MKMMSDKKMDMSPGQPDSDGFFPDAAHKKNLGRIGDIRKHAYPDTEEMVKSESESFVKNVSKNMPKDGFRH